MIKMAQARKENKPEYWDGFSIKAGIPVLIKDAWHPTVVELSGGDFILRMNRKALELEFRLARDEVVNLALMIIKEAHIAPTPEQLAVLSKFLIKKAKKKKKKKKLKADG